jgi:hypothetical protein
MTYTDAAVKAHKIINDGGDSEDLRLAVGEAIKTSPSSKERSYWEAVSGKLAEGLAIKSKELES